MSGTATSTRPRNWSHAQSYKGGAPAALIHRARLRRVASIITELDLAPQGTLVDLGCSDGFIVSQLRLAQVVPAGWRVSGYDHSQRLVELAQARDLPNSYFATVDLNDSSAMVAEPGDLVICLETLEHVGDYRSALEVIHRAIAPGGILVLSMPNEVGLVGLCKLAGRPLFRPKPYKGFFADRRGVLDYALDVGLGKDIERFRQPPRPGWGPHLGFDYRAVLRHISRTYLNTGAWVTQRLCLSAGGANRFLVARRAA